jgi:hypothetical protein
MNYQVILLPNHDSKHFLQNISALLNNAQDVFHFRLMDESPNKYLSSEHLQVDVDEALQNVYSFKTECSLRDEDFVIQFINKSLVSTSRGLINLFIAASSIGESSPRVAVISTSFIRKHILPVDPTYIIQRHAFYHLIVCCLVGAFLEIDAREDRGCLMDFNSFTPNIRHKIENGYTFCEACTTIVDRHPLGKAVFEICGALKVGAETTLMPLKKTKKKRVFLCYSGADREKVLELYERLNNDGFEPWMDKKNIIGGQDWRLEICRAIETSDYFVACLSQSFQERTYGHKEIKLALEVLDTMPEGAIYLIPVRLENCIVETRLADRQWVDLFESNGYQSLLAALRWANSEDKNAQ